MSAAEIEERSGPVASQAYRAIDRLTQVGRIQGITGRKKNRVCATPEVLAELDDLDRCVQTAMA